MIDLHSHILPGLDDGAATLEDAVGIGKAAVADGMRVIAATPHVRADYPTTPEQMEQQVDSAGLWGVEDTVFQLQLRGFRIVLAHPERNGDVQASPERLASLVERGMLVQLTAASLDGRLGRGPRKTGLPCPERDSRQWRVRDRDRQAGFGSQEHVEGGEEGTAADECDATFHEVGRQLGGRPFEDVFRGGDDLLEWSLQRVSDLFSGDVRSSKEAGGEVSARDVGAWLRLRNVGRRTDLDLQRFGLFLSDQKSLSPLDRAHDRVVHLVAADLDRVNDGEASECGDGDLGGAASDVDDERPNRLRDREARPERGRHWLFDQKRVS